MYSTCSMLCSVFCFQTCSLAQGESVLITELSQCVHMHVYMYMYVVYLKGLRFEEGSDSY